jgi:hypothetical protein
MQNMVRRQMSRGEIPTGDKLELRELKGRLVMENGRPFSYGTTNVAFQDDDETSSVEDSSSVSLSLQFTIRFILITFCFYCQLIFIYTKDV